MVEEEPGLLHEDAEVLHRERSKTQRQLVSVNLQQLFSVLNQQCQRDAHMQERVVLCQIDIP